tara:strand:+ start:57 stop:419 length:363 start_codon:yes stop_codon:yes gene_type:complete
MANPYRNTGKAGTSSPAQFNPFKDIGKYFLKKHLKKQSKPMAVPAKNLKLLNKNRIPFEATIKPTNVPVVGTLKKPSLTSSIGGAAAATGGYILGKNENNLMSKEVTKLPKKPVRNYYGR